MNIHAPTEGQNATPNRGFALLVVLLIVAILAAMVGEFLFGVRLQAELLANHQSSVKARFIGRSAFNAYKYLIGTNQFDPQNPQAIIAISRWAGFGSGLQNLDEGEMVAGVLGMKTTPLDPSPDGPLRGQWSVPLPTEFFDLAGSMYGRMVNERGKLNLNAIVNCNLQDRSEDTVNRKVYNRLLTLFMILGIDTGDATTCLDGLVDWIDGNYWAEANGAEEDYYRSFSDHPYYPRNDYLQSVDEMRLVRGCTPEMVERVKPFVTVYPRKGPNGTGLADDRIDAAVAPKAVLMAVFLASPDESGASPNDNVTADQVCEDIYTQAVQRCNVTITISDSGKVRVSSPSLLSAKDIKEIIADRLTGDFDFYTYSKMDAQYYHIRAVGEVKGVMAGVEAVLKKNLRGIEVLYWRED